MKVCTECWSPCMPGTEHRVKGKAVCDECVREGRLTVDPPKERTIDEICAEHGVATPERFKP